ncbi:hypothetical protein PVAP13_2KG376061 [Panicum virgatum]|uniref:Uncharacterized protein n=1 Tax=Panicum virgatum TaxID=38727 RepID=A0A8T0WBJ2_PANVG|nr:hypothetical protein PVAP13_2KG376061 [Panicum virgatum]
MATALPMERGGVRARPVPLPPSPPLASRLCSPRAPLCRPRRCRGPGRGTEFAPDPYPPSLSLSLSLSLSSGQTLSPEPAPARAPGGWRRDPGSRWRPRIYRCPRGAAIFFFTGAASGGVVEVVCVTAPRHLGSGARRGLRLDAGVRRRGAAADPTGAG